MRPAGGLVVDMEGERYRIGAGDVKVLIFSGRPAPIRRERVRREGGSVVTELTVEGYAAVNQAGRAVVIRTRAGAWIVPLVSFRRVAYGEGGGFQFLGLWGRGGRTGVEHLPEGFNSLRPGGVRTIHTVCAPARSTSRKEHGLPSPVHGCDRMP